MAIEVTYSLVSIVLLFCINIVTAQYIPCQIQSFYAQQCGSGRGNLLRVHLSQNGSPTKLSFTGSCEKTTLKFTKFMEERRVMNGTVTVSIRWAQDRRYVLAVKEGALTIEFSPKKSYRKKAMTSEIHHWFILRSACDRCYAGLTKLETLSTPHLFVESDDFGTVFMGVQANTKAWLEIVSSACS